MNEDEQPAQALFRKQIPLCRLKIGLPRLSERRGSVKMRNFVSPLLAVVVAISGAVTALPAAAQQYSNYGPDPCQEQRDQAGRNGAAVGAVVGGLAGAGVADRKNRTEGALLGALVGGLAGRQIGRSQARCAPYPQSVEPRRDCRWVYEGADGFEICPGRDGIWRPSGRG